MCPEFDNLIANHYFVVNSPPKFRREKEQRRTRAFTSSRPFLIYPAECGTSSEITEDKLAQMVKIGANVICIALGARPEGQKEGGSTKSELKIL